MTTTMRFKVGELAKTEPTNGVPNWRVSLQAVPTAPNAPFHGGHIVLPIHSDEEAVQFEPGQEIDVRITFPII